MSDFKKISHFGREWVYDMKVEMTQKPPFFKGGVYRREGVYDMIYPVLYFEKVTNRPK